MSPRLERLRAVPTTVLALALALAAVTPVGAQVGLATRQIPSSGPVTRASGRCGVCHPADRVTFEKGPHAAEGLHCTSCHGGDDQAVDEAAAHGGKGFRGRIARQDIPTLCASCHSDEKLMRPYDLPVDQYALYETSGHGQKLKQGDTSVAVCSDCHGAHDDLSAHDPASRVYVTNLPGMCGSCHGDTTRVHGAAAGHGPNPYEAYRSSVHAQELFDAGNRNAPTCVSCHGVHGAAPTNVGDVNKICGRCHTAERRYFLSGPHATGMALHSLAECSSCHGDHAIQRRPMDDLATLCVKCHPTGSRDELLGHRLLADYRSASDAIQKAEAQVVRADAVPIQTDDYQARVEEARTYLREALIAAHAVDPEVMAGFTVRARSVGQEVESEVRGKLRNILIEKLALVIFWFYVLVTVGILRRFRDRPNRVE